MSRSAMVFAAQKKVVSRFALVHMVAKGMRALRRGERLISERPADTTNEVFARIAHPEHFKKPVPQRIGVEV
jgi:hypothetical protein